MAPGGRGWRQEDSAVCGFRFPPLSALKGSRVVNSRGWSWGQVGRGGKERAKKEEPQRTPRQRRRRGYGPARPPAVHEPARRLALRATLATHGEEGLGARVGEGWSTWRGP